MKHFSLAFKLLILGFYSFNSVSGQSLELSGLPGKSVLIINNPDVDGIVINNAVDDGIVLSAGDIGLLVNAGYSAGFFTSSGNHDEGAIYVANGNTNFPDIELGGGLIRSLTGFNFRMDRFNSANNYKFDITKQNTSLFSVDEAGFTEFSQFMSVSPSGRIIKIGSDIHNSPAMIEMTESGTGVERDGVIRLRHATEGTMILIDASGSSNEPYIHMNRTDGSQGIILDVDVDGDSRITTDELEIKGGSDLAEHFDIEEADDFTPGMVVSIDRTRPGKLLVSRDKYDKKVAGIISGAKGIQSGMIMGQAGSIADGEHPVALVGRVFALADATQSPILPGDLLTTSDIPGHVMKVKNHKKAKGAIVGKAMTSLNSGRGYVLVLVNLQ